MLEPIEITSNPEWINKQTRPACKYSPIVVSKNQKPFLLNTMRQVVRTRIATCISLSILETRQSYQWFSFLKKGPLFEPHLRENNVPVMVISGGNANKISLALNTDYSLAWHPAIIRDEPVYLLVHKKDFQTYALALKTLMEQYRNLHLIGWSCGQLTGFGVARAATLAFADSLFYRPKRILMLDQDVVQTEGTRHTNPLVIEEIEKLHKTTDKQVIGLGVGYPTRQAVPKPFQSVLFPNQSDFNSPTQQFVSIQAPFRKRNDEIYPPYMVAGGEDMLIGMKMKVMNEDINITLRQQRIVKKELKGPADTPNYYWNNARVETLKILYEAEKNTLLKFENDIKTLDELLYLFVKKNWINEHPSADSFNVSACVIERIILCFQKLNPSLNLTDIW